MDLHRLRVVEFDTSVREKEREKKLIAELDNRKKEGKKTSTVGNGDEIEDENQCLCENTSPPGLSNKCLGEEISLLGASKKYLGDTSSPPDGAIKICVNDERTPPRISKQCSGDKLRLPDTSKKYINETTFTSHLGTLKNQRSKSEIFKIPPKKKPAKPALKINSSDLGLTKLFQDSAYSHQKKRRLNLRNRSRNARIHHKEVINEKKEKSEEVHFLFAREKPSFIRYRRKRTDNVRTKKKRDSKFPNDIYGFQTSNRSLDQYQYQMSHFNFIDTDKLPFKKFRLGFHRKPKPPQPVINCFCKHHAMRVLNSACGNSESRPIYYNLGTHPHPRRFQQKHVSDQEVGLRRERSHYMAKDEIVEVSPSLFSPVTKCFHDARTGPSNVELSAGSHHRQLSLLEKSTTLQNFTIASEYNQKSCPLPSAPSQYAACAVATDRQPCELKKSQTFQDVTGVGNQKPCPLPSPPSPCALCAARTTPAQNKCKKKRKKPKKPFLVFTLCNGFLSRLEQVVTDFHMRNNMSGKSCIKYVIFGLLIVVWSPCLLAVILAWVVMFPWKLTNILKTDVTAKRSFPINHSFKRFRKNNRCREYQQMCFENYLPEKKRSFMTSAASWYSRTVGVVVNSFNAVISLLKLKKKAPVRAGSSFLPSSHPNPRKRYKLFYADNRGWVMKPLRRRTRSCANNRVVQNMRCEFRPKFWQKIRCQNLQQESIKKVPCPVHGTGSYPMHQSSPAGDACPVQNRNPWPSCTCRDKYSQRAPAFMPLNSHHHRQQQVNTLPKFHPSIPFPSILTNATINTKPNMFNSIKITNNIAHENLAKDHLGQRKNRTLPFGVVVAKGLNKHNVGNTIVKASGQSGVHSVTSLTDITNHMPGKQTTKREIPLNCLSVKSHANKNSPTLRKKIYFSNKCVLTDIFPPALTKQATTSTFKNYAHKTQYTPKHIPYQKITNKQKTAKAKADMASKCPHEAKLFPSKQAYKYKTDKIRAPSQKHPSPLKIKSSIKHDIIVNYSFRNKGKQSKQGYKYKSGLVPVTTQILSNTAEITTLTNRDVALNCLCGKGHEKFKYGYEHKPLKISAATQKQLCTTDITTSTNRNVAFNSPRDEDHGLSKFGDKHKLHQIPVATQMQSGTSDNATDVPDCSTKHNVALNFPCEEKHKLSKHGYKHKPHNVPVATKMQLKTADITTSTNRNVATNFPCEEKHKLSNQCYKNKPHQILVATQLQSRTAENATDTNLALIRPSEEKHELSQHGYKYKLTMATQMQQRTADIATDTNRDVALNYPGGVKPSTANKKKLCIASTTDKETKYKYEINLSESVYKYIPGQIFVATQKQSNTADITTMTNCDIALNYPYGDKHEQSEQAYIHKSDHIPVGTQKQPSTADICTICIQNTNPPEHLSKTQDISIQKHSYMIDASTNCLRDYERSNIKNISLPERTISPKKTVNCTDATTSWEKTAPETQTDSLKKVTDCDLGDGIGGSRKLNDYCLYKGIQTISYSALKRKIENERQKRALSKEIVDYGCGTKLKLIATAAEIPFERQADKYIFAQDPSKQPPSPKSSFVGGTFRNVTTTQPLSSRQLQTEELIEQFQPHANSQLFGVASDSRYGLDKTRQDSNLQSNSQQLVIGPNRVCGVTHSQNKPDKKMAQIAANNTNTHKNKSAKNPSNTWSKLPQASSHTVQEEPKLFGIASDCICGTNQPKVAKKSSSKNILIEQSKVPKESPQGLKPGSVTVYHRKIRNATESPSTSTDIQELPCDCQCECNSVPPLKSKFPQYLPSAPPELSKKDKILSKLPKSPAHWPSQSSQKSSPLIEMALDCRRGEVSIKNEHHKELKADCKNILTQKTDSGKEPPSKPDLIQVSSRALQENSKFGIASDCTCGTNQTTAAEKNLYNNVAGSKSTRAKKLKSKSPSALKNSSISKFPKSPECSPLRKSLPHKCRWKTLHCKCRCKSLTRKCRCVVGSLQDSIDQQTYGSKESSTSSERNIVKVYMPRSKFTKSPERSRPLKSLPRKCRCPVESRQDSVGKPPYGTKLSKLTYNRGVARVDKTPKSSDHTPSHEYLQQTCPCPVEDMHDPVHKSAGTRVNKAFSKRNNLKVYKTRPKFPKSSEYTLPQEHLHHDCTCPVKNLQHPVNKKTSRSSQKSVFSRKSKRKSFDFPEGCSFSKNDLNKISLKSDVPVNWNTTKRFFIQSSRSTCSINEPSPRVQSSKISQCSNKVSSLVMSLRSKLFSRKNKHTKIPENSTKKPLPVISSSLQVKPKKADKRATSVDDILVSLLGDASNQSLFRRSNKPKKSQNPSFPLHSSPSSCSFLIHKISSRQCSRKKQYISKPLIVNKSYSCLHSVAKTFQRPSFLSHSSKYDSRTESIISQQSKTLEHSSIVTLFTRKSNSKSQSMQKQSSQKFDLPYSSTLINCLQTPTVRQTVRSQLPPNPKSLKSKNSLLFNIPQSKPFFEKIRSITNKISTNSLKDEQEKKVSTPGVQSALIYSSKCAWLPENLHQFSNEISRHSVQRATIRQPKVSEQSFQLCSSQPNMPKKDSFHRSYPPKVLTEKKQFEGSFRCAEELKITKEYLSNHKQFEVIPQPPKAKQVIPIISGRCKCAGEQNNARDNSSNKKLHPNTKLPVIRSINSLPLGNEKKPEFSQHLTNQTFKSPAFNLARLDSSHQTGTPHNAPLRHFQSTHKKPCKCRSSKHGNEQEVSNKLHKIVKNKRSQEKFHKSHLISHFCSCSTTTRRLREHIVHRSEISQSPVIQSSPQIQIYEQNLPDQKRLSKIPTNVDKPPPEMLQQQSPEQERKSTAEGEIRLPYPDFNRVSIRYSGHKSPPKPSLQIPGINGPPPANNYPPAPGATPPLNYASDPCYTNLPKRCLPKSPYDESALRRAYKRRPLRYTPPRQQLPRVVMVKKLQENKQRAAEAKRRKGIQRKEPFLKCLRRLINKTEREVWPTDVKCHPMWLNALKRKPCFYIYKVFPRAYPTFLNCYKTHKCIGQLLVYFITLCFWSPLLLCGYLCCNVLCKCCS